MMPPTKWQAAKWRALEDAAIKFIVETVAARGYPPSVRELAAELGYRSTSTTHAVLARLHDQGRIRRKPGEPRAITVVAVAEEAS